MFWGRHRQRVTWRFSVLHMSICVLVGLIIYAFSPQARINHPFSDCDSSESTCQRLKSRYAYATILCDDHLVSAASVLFHSVRRTQTVHEFLVLAISISNKSKYILKLAGAKVVAVNHSVNEKFHTNENHMGISNPCRHSKLLLWNMSAYQKLIYLDSDMLVLNNIDELFELPSLSAAPNAISPDKFSSGLMVIEPNQTIFRDMLKKVAAMPSPMMGDDAFLNSYYHDWYSQEKRHSINILYNSVVLTNMSPVWSYLVTSHVKIIHFSGPEKPWNRMTNPQVPRNEKLNELWLQMYDEVQDKLGRVASTAVIPSKTVQCGREFMAYQRGKLMADKLSVVINSFDRFAMLKYMVKRYASMDFIHKIYIVWGNTNVAPFPLTFFNATVPIEIIYTGLDNLNDRFLPIQSLETEAVLICDDDVEVNMDALQTAFVRWQDAKYRLVGFFPRGHYVDEGTKKLVYVLGAKQHYSMVLTKMMLMHGDYLQLYTCTLPPSVLLYVDSIKNCEDILMNMMVTHLSGSSPLLLLDETKVDYGTTSGLSFRVSHDDSRSTCMNELVGHLGYVSLKNSSEAVVFYGGTKHLLAEKPPEMKLQPVLGKNDQFMEELTFADNSHGLETTDVPGDRDQYKKSVLCIHGGGSNSSAFVERHAVVSIRHLEGKGAWLLHGTSMLVFPVQAFTSRFDFLSLVAGLYQWRMAHGCFAPTNILLVSTDLSLLAMTPWKRNLMQTAMGGNVQLKLKYSHLLPECFENAVVVRKSNKSTNKCHPAMALVRLAVVENCKNLLGSSSMAPVPRANATMNFILPGNGTGWGSAQESKHASLGVKIQNLCSSAGVRCSISTMAGGSLCEYQTLFGSADVVIGLWGDAAMDNVVFLKPGAIVVEITPSAVDRQAANVAMAESNCLGLRYEQVEHKEGPEPVLQVIQNELMNSTKVTYEEGNVLSIRNTCPHKIFYNE